MNWRMSSSVDQTTCLAGGLGRLGDVLRLRLFFLAREVLPKIRDGVNAVRAGERLFQAFDVVEVRFDNLHTG